MPFKSEKQRRYLWANEPEIARRWTKEHGSRIQKDDGGIMRLPFAEGSSEAQDAWADLEAAPKETITITPEGITKGEESFDINMDYMHRLQEAEEAATAKFFDEHPNASQDSLRLQFMLKELRKNFAKQEELFSPIGVLGDEGMNLEEFMDERLEERIEKEKRKIEEQLGIGGMGLPSLPKEPFYKEADPGQPVWDFETNKYYDPITGREVPNPNIPQKRNMDTMPYIKEPFSPIGQFASFGGFKEDPFLYGEEGPVFDPLKLMSNPQFDEDEDEDENVPVRFRDAKTLAEYNASRRANRYWNRGETRTVPERFGSGFRNIAGDIRRGLGSIRQRVSNFMGDRFKYRPAVGRTPAYYGTGAPMLDKRGQPKGYSAAYLNQLNARGGYYSEPAREARRVDQRRINILNRTAAEKPLPVGNVNQLLGQYGYSSDGGGGIQFTGGGGYEPANVGQQTSGRADTSWKSDPFAKGGLASIWPR